MREQAPQRDHTGPDPEESRRLVRRYFDLINGGELSRADEVLASDIVFFGPRAPDGIRGLDAFRDFVVSLRHDSPDLHFAEGETVVEGDRVASVFTMTRTHPTEATKTITTEGMDLFEIAAGKIQRINANFDRLGLLVEMGIMEPPPEG